MIDTLQEYAWDARECELDGLRESGYDIVYSDVSLEVIYEELENCFEGHETVRNIKDIFGYYGPGALLKVNGIYHWLMQS